MGKTNLNILIDAELKARLKTLAERENRTLSNLVETELKRLAGMKVGVPMQALTSSLGVEFEELASYLLENQQPLEPEFQKVLYDNYWELLSE